jgi:cellulose synthase/poly-beta-1,6-N-acetylglucosamine synthase-like glycosyltransferase
MTSEPRTVAVVVCTRNRLAELERCLSSLDSLDPAPDEVIVVNSAGDETARKIAAQHAAKYVYAPVPGLSHARNVGAASARSDLIAYLDDDAVADQRWIARLVAPFYDDRAMVVTGRIDPLDLPNAIGDRYLEIAFQRAFVGCVDRETLGWFWLANTGHIGVGGNMMLRREAFQHWPGFDTRLGRGALIAGSEEHCAFFQLIDRGYRCIHVPEAVVSHPGVRSAEQLQNFEIQMIENAIAYFTLLFAEYPAHRRELLRGIMRRF